MEPSKVVKALKVLQEEGWEDLLKEGVLGEAWVGLRRPKRLSAEGVSAAVAACTSPVRTGKKFRCKSATGRKVAGSPDNEETVDLGLPGHSLGGLRRRGICSLPRRQGSSLLKRVTAGGRGSVIAVARRGLMGAQIRFAHARIGSKKQTCAPVERGAERDGLDLEEGTLAGTSKMAAPSAFGRQSVVLEEGMSGSHVRGDAHVAITEDDVVVISDDEEEVQLGEQIELVDHSGTVFKGTVCGERISSGAMGRADVSLDLRHPDVGEGTSWCDTSHASSGHGLQVIHRRSGRIVGEQSVPVKVRAPSVHRKEWRVKPGAVYPTSGETFGDDEAQPSASQDTGAGLACMEEELLDYDDDFEEPVSSRQRVVLTGDMPGEVQGVRSKAHYQDVSAGSLPRGEVGLVGSVMVHELQKNLGGLSGASVLEVVGGSKERRTKMDACIQVALGVLTRCAPFGLGQG
ncbi:hypothetical protein NDU88_006724 [Pleurodeles waltl]|uniref:Uncharacterized protein n=1 Tax=Pleurodeles waltl TaxID=8319 RepID=A0AAV7RM99_PLEWA|nr:hypothetical protein NDU88_006724 [Pleurodeles waltl]